jgi:heat-inducible transcriptional repressor
MKLDTLDSRSRDILRHVIEAYLETGDPVGSRTLSRLSKTGLSPASIRNIMSDLEFSGLLFAPHTSAGRLPTEIGLRLFVDGLLEVGSLTKEERSQIDVQCAQAGRNAEDVLSEASTMLSGLSQCASIVMVPKYNAPLRHIEFVSLSEGRGLVVLVFDDGSVENRLIDLPLGLPASSLQQATNFLNSRLQGKTLDQTASLIEEELASHQAELDELTRSVVAAGVATWSGAMDDSNSLIVRGRSNLLEQDGALENLERIRQLFDDLEKKRDLVRLLQSSQKGEGVRIFIGAENQLFSLSGSSVIVSPFMGDNGNVVGAIGVIGPTRLNYGRIIPMVDYTAHVIGKIL